MEDESGDGSVDYHDTVTVTQHLGNAELQKIEDRVQIGRYRLVPRLERQLRD